MLRKITVFNNYKIYINWGLKMDLFSRNFSKRMESLSKIKK